MDLSYSDDDLAFRDEVRAFLDEKLTKELSDKIRLGGDLTKADMEGWHATLNAQGWLAQNGALFNATFSTTNAPVHMRRALCRLVFLC